MKTILKSLTIALVALFSSSVAFATESPTPPPPAPLPVMYTLDITGGTFFAGIGQGSFEGGAGEIIIDKVGGGESILNVEIGGDFCGPDCQNGSYDFTATAFEGVQVQGTVIGNEMAMPTILQNSGQTLVGAQLMFQRAEADTSQ
jgi:hypothetical protein